MGIAPEDVRRVKEATDILALVQSHSALRRVGRRWVGLCPFHQEKTPSFSVNAEEGLYYCFGCGVSGDILTFVREKEGLDFRESVELLAGRAGITLTYTADDDPGARHRKQVITEAIGKAVAWYHERLLSHPGASRARGYLRSRGIEGDQVREFCLGWAPNEYEALRRSLDVPEKVMLDAGLIYRTDEGRTGDTFRGRILFPIFDNLGVPVGFGGRAMPDGPPPKYKNSPESGVYSKSRLLYNLHLAKKDIVGLDEVVICEGYTDVLGLFGIGVKHCVATCGTSLTEEHVKILRRFTERFVLAFDADSAGASATERIYQWERKYSLQAYVAELPEGGDPADLARSDPAALREALEAPVAFLSFRLNRALEGRDLSTPEGRARAGEAAVAVIAEHPDEMVRDQYLMLISDRLQIPPRQLRDIPTRSRSASQVGSVHGEPSANEPDGGRRRPARRPKATGIERQVLQLCVHHPDLVPDYVSAGLFADPLHQKVFRALRSSDTPKEALALLSPKGGDEATPESRLLANLVVSEPINVKEAVVGRFIYDAAEAEIQRLLLEVRKTGDADIGRRMASVQIAREELRNHDWDAAAAARVADLLDERD